MLPRELSWDWNEQVPWPGEQLWKQLFFSHWLQVVFLKPPPPTNTRLGKEQMWFCNWMCHLIGLLFFFVIISCQSPCHLSVMHVHFELQLLEWKCTKEIRVNLAESRMYCSYTLASSPLPCFVQRKIFVTCSVQYETTYHTHIISLCRLLLQTVGSVICGLLLQTVGSVICTLLLQTVRSGVLSEKLNNCFTAC